MMSDQFNIYPDTPETGETIYSLLRLAHYGIADRPMFSLQQVEGVVTASLCPCEGLNDDTPCCFIVDGAEKRFRHGELIHSTGLIKSGCHDPNGILLLYGPGIRRNSRIEDCSNLDIAPTLLTILGVPVPSNMTGRVLEEAFAEHGEVALTA
jgi:hypothetical protein